MNSEYGIHAQLAYRVISMLRAGYSVAQAAEAMSIHPSTVYKWRRSYEEHN